jgi:hypothetical protein
MKIFFFLLGIVILVCAEVARVYLIMPFPGSQKDNAIDLAYFLHNNLYLIRIGALLVIAYPAYLLIRYAKAPIRWTAVALIVFWLFIFYNSNFRLLAEKIFYQPEHKVLVSVSENKVHEKALVLGVFINNEAKAYPLEIIGYHHQVRDTVGGEPVMVTYCTVCRSGRVYSPFVEGKPESFRLVGMDHFNAMFEDSRTKSWWRQANGEAIVGPLKGDFLREIVSEQMTLKAWLSVHPKSLILQPDSIFKKEYEGLAKYDEGKMEGSLERTDSLSWQQKSWVVGVAIAEASKAYDWIELKNKRVINDDLDGHPLLVVLETDTASFHVWDRVVDNDTLSFAYSDSLQQVVDVKTNSVWNWNGKCIEGAWKDKSLMPLQSYQEYWHSWQTFHPKTQQYPVTSH